MRIVFISNFFNHHQCPVADELNRMPGVEYTFVETMAMPAEFAKSGYPDFSGRSYLLKAYLSDRQRQKAIDLAYDADVVIIGSAPESYVAKRILSDKLTFRYAERWFKDRPWYLHGVKSWKKYAAERKLSKRHRLYMLAASAYTANDLYSIFAYKNKVFKWGYFTKVDENFEFETVSHDVSTSEFTPLMWCSRFLKWKHPELPVMMAARLKSEGYAFTLDMYGSGVEQDNTRDLIDRLGVGDMVRFKGNLPNDEILKAMRQHEIFLFTSDRYEGWGAVLNESMSNGCAVIASDEIGAAPFLIKDGTNGLLFKSGSLESLCSQCRRLLDDVQLRNSLRVNAVKTMRDVWSPRNAANNLYNLCESLLSGTRFQIEDGPCSLAVPYKQ